MLEWLERKFKSSYVKLLEEENARLLEENRQLINSALARAGFSAIDPRPQTSNPAKPIPRPTWQRFRAAKERQANEMRIESEKAAAAENAAKPKPAGNAA